MTSQTSENRYGWRRAVLCGVASSALVAGLLTGFGVSTAFAQPADPSGDNKCTGDDCAKNDAAEAQAAGAECAEGDDDCQEGEAPTMTAEQALAIISRDYDLGAGGGQLSNLIHDVMTLRAQGFKPSKGNVKAIQEALEHRPNQTPLVEALKATLAYQRKLQAQAANAVASSPAVIGVGQLPPGVGPTTPPGIPPEPGDNQGVFIGVPGGGVNQPIG